MQQLSLDGTWTLVDGPGEFSLDAIVPGDVMTDLRAAGKICDPYYRENELELQWIGERDWIYEREFDVSPALLKEEQLRLQCEGLDTFAEIQINGSEVARTNNMHRRYEWDIKSLLKAGSNTIRITLRSVNEYTRERFRQRPIRSIVGGGHPNAHPAFVRKEACNFGWDWGPILVTAGIWRSIRLTAFSGARLNELDIRQTHGDSGVVLDVTAGVEAAAAEPGSLSLRLTLRYDDELVAESSATGRSAAATLTLDSPRLWWPAGMGGQPLYELSAELLDPKGNLLDSQSKRIGLRSLKLERHKDEWGESFQFVVNGIPFFAKGSNWIPVDALLARREPAVYQRLLDDALAANMNMIRVWGGGIYEDDCFYELCDERGLCVWQDFMFACMAYPATDEQFLENAEQEARDNVRRLRHHACMALWCGNNEIEEQSVGTAKHREPMTWEEYKHLFDEILGGVVRELAPETDYWPSSPHSPQGDRAEINNPACGDAHLWGVWHGKQPFEWYRSCDHRFNSEFGFQSFPEPKTVYRYTEPQDRNVTSAVMEHHQRSGIGNTTIMQYMLEWFRLPTSFDMILRASQILQGMAIKYAVEHWRRSMPRGMGTLYWQLNDCWPVASWSSIDYYGRWKALHYMARHFYAPVLLSGVEDPKTGRVAIHVTSDRLEPAAGTLCWTVTDAAGRELESGEQQVQTPVNGDAQVAELALQSCMERAGKRNTLVWLNLKVAGEADSNNLITFVRPKHLELADAPGIAAELSAAETGFRVTLRTEKPALWAWLELEEADARFSDNFIHLRPGQPVELEMLPAEELSLEDARQKLVLRSLADTY